VCRSSGEAVASLATGWEWIVRQRLDESREAYVLVSFYHCGKRPERNHLKKGKVCFGSQFRGFSL
jgi:hypothetical protein